jgi:hypothetical protein
MLTRRRLLLVVGAVVGVSLGALGLVQGARVLEPLPTRLTDREFWQISTDLSEPDGTFRSDNLLSNERFLQHVIPTLTKTAKKSGIYLGVGPEQNFTYMAALQPRMAFIVDIRRGNLHLHLMYKALFELSADRAEFVSRLFSKKRPPGLSTKSSAEEIFTAFSTVETGEALYKENLAAVQDHLARTHGYPLSSSDVAGVEYVYSQFYWHGPSIQYWSTGGRGGGGWRSQITYAELMIATDSEGRNHSFLSSEDRFRFLKDLHAKNLIVPVVGDFAGPKALRSVSKYLKEHGGVVSAFYLSNVEQYLERAGVWQEFCANAATLPADETSQFIRSVRGSYSPSMGLSSELGVLASEVKDCR